MPFGRGLREALVNAFIGMIGTLFVLFGTGAWSSRESASAHRDDMNAVRLLIESDVLALHAGIDSVRSDNRRILDAVCDRSSAHVCSEHP